MFRTYVSGAHGPHPWSRRKGGDGFAYQGFNYPKSVWGGQLKAKDAPGSTATSGPRSTSGWAAPTRPSAGAGSSRSGEPAARAGTAPDRAVIEDVVRPRRTDAAAAASAGTTATTQIRADFIIDCTGLEADIAEHRVLADLLAHGGARAATRSAGWRWSGTSR